MTVTAYKRAGLIGVGLIGSSVALGLKKRGLVETWVGMDSDPQAIEEALRIGSIQEMTTDLRELVREVDWLLIAVPVRSVIALAQKIIPLISNPHYFMMDVGSTKTTIVETMDRLFVEHGRPNCFIGSHPIAGKEKTGPLAADPDLFQGKTIYLTPSAVTDAALVAKVDVLWRALGGEVRQIDSKTHDDILSVSSHLPHMIAFALMDAVKREYEARQINHSLGGGLRDMTRVVSSSPQMWADICLENKTPILKQIDVFRESLDELYALLKRGEEEPLKQFFSDKKQFRDKLG